MAWTSISENVRLVICSLVLLLIHMQRWWVIVKQWIGDRPFEAHALLSKTNVDEYSDWNNNIGDRQGFIQPSNEIQIEIQLFQRTQLTRICWVCGYIDVVLLMFLCCLSVIANYAYIVAIPTGPRISRRDLPGQRNHDSLFNVSMEGEMYVFFWMNSCSLKYKASQTGQC